MIYYKKQKGYKPCKDKRKQKKCSFAYKRMSGCSTDWKVLVFNTSPVVIGQQQFPEMGMEK